MEGINWDIREVQEISSTNEALYTLINDNKDLNEGIGIRSAYQTMGKGQIGKYWHSKANKNLLLSFLLQPSISISQQFAISQMISLSLVDLLTSLDIEEVRIKWPNDIYVGDLKIAGLLIQNLISGKQIKESIIGIGLNVNQVKFPGDIPNPTSLSLVLGRTFEIAQIQELLLDKINEFYAQLFDLRIKQLNKLYHFLLYRRGVLSKFKREQEKFEGTITGVDPLGHLLIETDLGIEKFNFRDIQFVI